jgi:cell division septation protein DedD
MKQERNADALSNSLKQRGFPVIVFRHTTDPFYRVVVGPYPDMSSAVRVKNELKAQNFEGIVRRWVPE